MQRGPTRARAVPRGPRGRCWRLDTWFEALLEQTEPTRLRLARSGKRAGQRWLWCIVCERFFQARELALDRHGGRERCPFEDCGAAGLDAHVFNWDMFRDTDPGWPRCEAELFRGRRHPPGPRG